jgi:hypothetical protein
MQSGNDVSVNEPESGTAVGSSDRVNLDHMQPSRVQYSCSRQVLIEPSGPNGELANRVETTVQLI